MSPFKSITGRSLGKILEGYRSSTMGSSLGVAKRGTTSSKFEVTITGSGNIRVNSDTTDDFYFYVFTNPGSILLNPEGLSSDITTEYAIIGGGASAPGYNSSYVVGTQGSDSSAFGNIALGGGVGGAYPGNGGTNGGSGGGGGAPNGGGGDGQSYPGPNQQGYPGGDGAGTYGGGGGGGAGQEGQNAVNDNSGNGGDGIVLNLDKAPGSSVGSLLPSAYGASHPSQPGRWFAGGGGGGGGSGTPNRGGYGGGGMGVVAVPEQPQAFGQENTGGGGGGWDGPTVGGGGAGGGGAGGVVQGTKIWTPADIGNTYQIEVGSGGASAPQFIPATAPKGNQGGSGIFIIRIPK